MSDEAAFLTALKANPADDTTRLVYADWLEERDEQAKGQYLRAVVDLTRHSGGTTEYNDAAARLYTACLQTDTMWRKAAGSRFDVILESYADKVYTIKIIRERTGFGLAESKALAESVPTALFSWQPFEVALPHLLAFHQRDHLARRLSIRAAIRPTMWPNNTGQETLFDVHLCECNLNDLPGGATARIAQLLRVTMAEAHELLKNLPLAIGIGLQPAAVAEFVRQLKLICNVYRPLPPGAIRVVPRLPS